MRKKNAVAVILLLFCLVGCTNMSQLERASTPGEQVSADGDNIMSHDDDDSDGVVEENESSEEIEQGQNIMTSALDQIYVNGYNKNSGVFISESVDFYDNFMLAIVDTELMLSSDGATIEDEGTIWSDRIDFAVENIKKEANYAKYLDQIETAFFAWENYEAEIYQLYNGLYGQNGVVPGSVYHDMVVKYALMDYEIIGGTFLSWEFELLGSNEMTFSILSEEADISEVNISEYNDRTICMDADDSFFENEVGTDIDNLNSEELYEKSKMLCSDIDEIAGSSLGFESFIDDYYELIVAMEDVEADIIGEEKAQSVKKERIRYMYLRLLNAKYLMNIY